MNRRVQRADVVPVPPLRKIIRETTPVIIERAHINPPPVKFAAVKPGKKVRPEARQKMKGGKVKGKGLKTEKGAKKLAEMVQWVPLAVE